MRKLIILAFAFTFCGNILHAQQLASTLLWKISGNGLQKPSYLYGTMHLTDERIFNIGDSMYKAIENSDGFAIEVDPDAFTPFIIDEAKRSFMETRRLKDMMSEKDFKKYGKALAKKLNKDEDDITTADVFKEKNKWIEESYRTGKMQTFLDAYLFDVARRQGKWTGGVEDMQDQENLFNNLVDESDVEEIASGDDNNDGDGKEKTNSALEQMISMYVKNDLNAIDKLSDLEDSAYHDKLLTTRNKKMAMRMDSLSHERSMVFAVGVAHLPGSDGLISLLREKGFTVTPVFSSKKIKPADYKVQEITLPWYDVKDESGFYSASMPGKPGDMTMYGILNMKLYFDIFKSTIYMTTALNTPYSESMADSVFGSVTQYYFGTSDYKKGKPITINNVPGREFSSDDNKYSRGYLLYKDGMMYMALATSMKKDTSAAGSINRFLHSFTIHETSNKTDDTKYITYTNAAGAYSIDVPAQPKSGNDLSGSEEKRTIDRDLNIVIDPRSGDYFFFGTNQAAPGYFIENDSTMLAGIKDAQKDKFSELSIDTAYFINAHRAMDIGGILVQAPLMMRAHYEFRGNRWYALVAMYDPKKEHAVVDRFFSSFKMLDYAAKEWKEFSTDNGIFTTWAPDKMIRYDMTDSLSALPYFKYECFDSSRADDFVITEESFSKYYWQKNDSILLEKLAHTNIKYNDSILSEKPITNGDVKGIEMLVQEEGSANVRRKRLLLNDNKLYSIVTIQPITEIYNSNNNKFFEDFRFAKELPSDALFTSKAKVVLQDIASEDSAVSNKAKDYLASVPFSKEELPMLHEALLKKYADDTADYSTTKEALQRVILDIKDSSSYYFARNNYATASEKDKDRLLEIMGAFPTAEHFKDIATLLLQQPPKEQPGYSFAADLTDSLSLAAGIFPQMLPLLKDSIMAGTVVRMAARLLDSGLTSIASLQPYQQDLLAMSQRNYRKLKNDPDAYDYANYLLLDVLAKMNTAATNASIQNWSLLKKSPYTAMHATAHLLQNKQTLNPVALQNLAAAKETRAALYDTLRAYKKQNLFPKEYLTQKYFAESYVYSAASDDDDPSDLTYLTQKVINFKGKQSRFFFYKVTYGEDDDASYTLACAGPFNVNVADVSADHATGDIYYDEDFDPENLPAQMDALIKQMEDWFEWDKKTDE